jgi:hypothetical protein
MTDKKKLSKYDPDLISEARKLAGTTSAFPKVSYTKIIYNDEEGPVGTFLVKHWDKEKEVYENHQLGKTFDGIILAVTRKCTQWDNDIGGNLYDSNEFLDYDETVQLVRGSEVEAKGTYRQLKQQYPELRLQFILYVYSEGLVSKFFVKGKSIMEFIKYEKSIIEGGSTMQGFKTNFSLRKEQNGAVTYYVIEFEKGEEQDLTKTIVLSKRVREGIDLFKDRFLSDVSDVEVVEGKSTTKAEVKEIATNKEPDAKEESLDDIPLDLPF